MDPEICLIAALADNGVIGAGNRLPWHIPSEFKYFRETTLGHPLIMGRKSFDSLGGKPLPGRLNIIVTRDKNLKAPVGAIVAGSLGDAFNLAKDTARKDGVDKVFVCGGAEIYRQTLPMAQKLYLTEIHQRPKGDTYFPDFDRSQWREIKRTRNDQDGYSITILQKL